MTELRRIGFFRAAARYRGVVMVLTLLAVVLLAALVFYVLNLGRQANVRVVTQHSADSAVAAGAGWVARSMNTVAMNNVAISRYLATVNTLDAFPLVTEATLDEQTFMRNRLQQNLGEISGNPVLNAAHDQANRLVNELQDEINLLAPIDDYFNASPDAVPDMTNYNGPNGRGHLWRAMEALDQFSQASMDNIGPLSQINAMRGGEVNLIGNSSASGAAAMVIPVVPQVPAKRGSFNDFERPVRFGRLSRSVDHATTNRGPYDAVFGWRRMIGGGGGGGGGGPSSVERLSSPLGGGLFTPAGGGGGGGSSQPSRPPTAYMTYGTQAWTLGLATFAVNGYEGPNLRHSSFTRWLKIASDTKLHYAWPGDVTRYFAKPHWQAEYPGELPAQFSQMPAFAESVYFHIEYKSKHPYEGSSFGSPGTWAISSPSGIGQSRMAITIVPTRTPRAGQRSTRTWWLDSLASSAIGRSERVAMPDDLNNAILGGRRPMKLNVFPVGAGIWVLQYRAHPDPGVVAEDPSIGITLQLDENGVPILQPAYLIQVVIYGGINTNINIRPTDAGTEPQTSEARSRDLPSAPLSADDIPIVNPYDGLDRSSATAPAPVDIDHTVVLPSTNARRQYLTYLGVARQGDTSLIWSSKFKTGQPYGNLVAIAQAKVFNDHSWDLWTQMWHAQLEPVTNFEDWLNTLDATSDDVGQVPGLSADEVSDLNKYLHSVAPMAPNMLNH